MVKNRKLVLILLLLAVMVFTTACVESEIKAPASVNGNPGSVNSDPGSVSGEADNTTVPAEDAVDASIEEAVLYEQGGIKITAKSLDESWMGPEVKLLIENNGSKNILITADMVSVNGYMNAGAGLYAEVVAGKKANEGLLLSSSGLEQSGIDTISQIQFFFNISDADTWNTVATSDLITLNTSAADYEQPVDDTGDVLYEGKGIRIVCKGLKQDILWDGEIVFYVENYSGKSISVSAENVSVNGFMEDAAMWSELRDGTRIIDSLSLMDLSDLELINIDEVENIEFNLRIIDADTWNEIATTDTISLDFN